MYVTVTREGLLDLCRGGGDCAYVMLVGVHGSGKTTLAEALHKRGFVRLSMDRMVSKNPLLGYQWMSLEARFLQKLRKRLSKRKCIVDDNLNTSPDARRRVLAEVRAAGYARIVVVFVDTPLAVCITRNAARGETREPDWVLHRVWASLHGSGRPSAHEADLMVILPNEDETRYDVRQEAYAPAASSSGKWRLVEWVKRMLNGLSG